MRFAFLVSIMPTPPLPHPTPFTCPHCGEALQTRADFCPHCGARVEAKTKPARSIGWFVGTIVLGLATLAFGGVGACSGAATYQSLVAPDYEFGQGLLVISIPLLIIGLVVTFLCGRALWRRVGK